MTAKNCVVIVGRFYMDGSEFFRGSSSNSGGGLDQQQGGVVDQDMS